MQWMFSSQDSNIRMGFVRSKRCGQCGRSIGLKNCSTPENKIVPDADESSKQLVINYCTTLLKGSRFLSDSKRFKVADVKNLESSSQ